MFLQNYHFYINVLIENEGYDVVANIISSLSPFQRCIKLPNLLNITIFYILFELLKFVMSRTHAHTHTHTHTRARARARARKFIEY